MRKRVRVPKPISVPMLINRGLMNDQLELRERMFVEAFSGGWATTDHFDNLADMRDCLMLAASSKNDQPVLAMGQAAGVALLNIKDRYSATKRMGATGDELKALRAFVETYKDFWLRQPVSAYEHACDALTRMRAMPLVEMEVGR